MQGQLWMSVGEIKSAIRTGKWDFLDIPRTNLLLKVKLMEKQIKRMKQPHPEMVWDWNMQIK